MESSSLIIAIDAMGGDHAPAEIVAIVSALEDLSIPAVPEGDHSIVVGVRRGAGEA